MSFVFLFVPSSNIRLRNRFAKGTKSLSVAAVLLMFLARFLVEIKKVSLGSVCC